MIFKQEKSFFFLFFYVERGFRRGMEQIHKRYKKTLSYCFFLIKGLHQLYLICFSHSELTRIQQNYFERNQNSVWFHQNSVHWLEPYKFQHEIIKNPKWRKTISQFNVIIKKSHRFSLRKLNFGSIESFSSEKKKKKKSCISGLPKFGSQATKINSKPTQCRWMDSYSRI